MGTFQTSLALVVLVYVLSIIVQAMQEFLKSIFKTKANTMIATIEKFMKKNLTLDQVNKALTDRGLNITDLEHFSKDDFRRLLDGIELSEDQAKGVLAPPVAQAAEGVQQLYQRAKDHIAGVYEAARSQFQKSYTAKNKLWVIGLSFVVVMLLNANVIMLYEELSADQVMSQAIAGTADKLIRNLPPKGNAPDVTVGNAPSPGEAGKVSQGAVKSNSPGKGLGAKQPASTSIAAPPPEGTAVATPAQQLKDSKADVCSAQDAADPTKAYENTRDCIRNKLKAYPILVRWAKGSKEGSFSWFGPKLAEDWNDGRGWFETVAGLLLMWVMVSLGAPFWNDVLKGMMGVNNALNANGKKTT